MTKQANGASAARLLINVLRRGFGLLPPIEVTRVPVVGDYLSKREVEADGWNGRHYRVTRVTHVVTSPGHATHGDVVADVFVEEVDNSSVPDPIVIPFTRP